MQANLDMPDKDSDYTYAYDITEEISASRHSIRHGYYLQQTTFTTFSKKLTDTELLQFSTQARHNKDLNYSHIITHKLSSRQKKQHQFSLKQKRDRNTQT